MKHFFISLLWVASIFCAVYFLVIALDWIGVGQFRPYNTTAEDFQIACQSVNGKAIWDGRQWQCLK